MKPGTYPTNGPKIKELRGKITQEEIATRCHFSIPTLQRAESGGPSYEATLRQIARVFPPTTWRDLLADPQEPEPSVEFAETSVMKVNLSPDNVEEFIKQILASIRSSRKLFIISIDPGSLYITICLNAFDLISLLRYFAVQSRPFSRSIEAITLKPISLVAMHIELVQLGPSDSTTYSKTLEKVGAPLFSDWAKGVRDLQDIVPRLVITIEDNGDMLLLPDASSKTVVASST